MMRSALAIINLMGLLGVGWIVQPAEAQVATVENIQSAPLEIEAPYTTFETPQPALILLRINEPASVSASLPFPNGFSDPSGTRYSSLLRYRGNEVSHGTTLSISEVGDAEVELEMTVARPQPYPSNRYSYSVLLTITVQ